MLLEQFNNYFYIFYSFLALISILTATEIDFKKNRCSKISYLSIICFIILFCVFFGTRDSSVGPDTEIYKWQFQHINDLRLEWDILYYYFTKLLFVITQNSKIFFTLISCFYLITLFIAIRIYAKSIQANILLIFFSFVSLFFFKSLGINIIRQGVSLSFFLLGTAYFVKNKNLNKYVFIAFLLAVGFHLTSIIPVVLFLLITFFKNIKIKFYYLLYFLCLGLAAINIGILNFKGYLGFLMVDERRNSYLSNKPDDLFVVGFKPQFVVFNTFFLILYIFFMKKYKLDSNYEILLKYYILMSSVFFMMFQIPYSDRWGVMSWVMIPFLLAPAYKMSNRPRMALGICFILITIFIFFNNL